MPRMLKVAENAFLKAPTVIAASMVAAQDACCCFADLLGFLESARRHSHREFLQSLAVFFHRRFSHTPLIGQPLFALDNKNAQARLLARYLRHHRAGHLFSFPGCDPYRTLPPRTLCSRLDVAIDLLVAPPFEPNEVTLSPLPQQSQVLDCHHPPVTDKDHPPQPEAFLQIFEHHLNGCRIAQAAIEDVMGNRPAVDHHQAHLHLAVAWLAIAAVSKVSKTCRPASLKIGACQVVEDHLDP